MRGYTGCQETAKWSLSGARPVLLLEVLGSGMVSSDPRGAIYYNTGCQYAAQWYVSGNMGSWSGRLQRHMRV